MKKFRKITILLIMISLICAISTVNYAADPSNIFDIPVVNNTAKPANNTANNTTNNVVNNAAINKSVNNTNTSLPKTGVNDSAMWVLIGACTLAAIYTYKKVRDYDV